MSNQSFSQMRLRNAESILSAVRLHSEISRADLARETDLSPATVSSIVDDLIKAGFLTQTGAKSTIVGRRPIGLVFNPEAGHVAGVRIGPDQIGLALADLDGRIKFEITTPSTESIEAVEIAEVVLKLARSACKSAGVSFNSLGAMGIAAPGPLKDDYPTIGGVRRSELYNNVKEQLARKLGFPVKMDTLVNMAALAEGLRGAGQGANTLLYVRVGHVMRSALLVNQELVVGKNNRAGEIGHIMMPNQNWICHCGKTGCVNAVAALPHFLDRCKSEGMTDIKVEDFADQVAHGNLRLHEFLAEAATAIGFALSCLINTLAPDAVIIAAPYTSCGAAFQDPLINALSKYCQHDLLTQCKIMQSQLRGSNEAFGAALLAMKNYPLADQVQTRL